MNLKLKYNDTEITDDIEYSSIKMYDRLGGMFDNLSIVVPSNEKGIIANDVQKNDTVCIDTDDYSSGIMYVDSNVASNTGLTINAISCNPTKNNPKSKIWRNAKFSEIMIDIAKNYGLNLNMYGVNDYSYESVSQIQETDLQLADRLCKREGYAIKVDNGNLIIFDEYTLENDSDAISISVNDVLGNSYSFKEASNCASSYTVQFYDKNKGLIQSTSIDEKCSSGSDMKKVEFISGFDEANRFSKGYLRDINKNRITGRLKVSYNPKISAGTVMNLSGFDEYDGKYIAYEVAHDVVLKSTSLSIRAILDY